MASHTMFSTTASSCNSERARPKSASSTSRKKVVKVSKRASEEGGYESSTNPATTKPAPLSPYSSHKERNSRAQESDFFEDGTNLQMFGKMGREELLDAIYQAKKAAIASDIIASNLRAENKRWENEVLKQQRRMDRLLESMATGNKGSGGSSSEEVRREIEKSLLARQLKQQITILKNTLGDRDAELEKAKKSQKSSKLLEMSNENFEYLSEIARLKEVTKRLHDELAREKRALKNALSRLAAAGAAAQKSTANSVLDNFGGFRAEQVRDEISRFLGGHAHAHATTDGGKSLPLSQAGSGGGQAGSRRPQSARAAPVVSSAVQPTVEKVAPPSAERPSSSLPVNVSPVRRANPIAEEPVRPAISEAAKPVVSASGAPADPYCVGDKVYGMFLGGRVWYNATVRACVAGGLYDLLYDDGDEEKGVPPSRVRPIEQPTAAPAPAPKAAASAAASAAATAGSKFKVGDEVEAFYYNGTTMYRAKVLVVYADRASGSSSYDIMYTDGEREKRVSEGKIKLFVEPPASEPPSTAEAIAERQESRHAAEESVEPIAAPPLVQTTAAAGADGVDEAVFDDAFDDAFDDFLDGGKAQFLNGSAEFDSVDDTPGAAQQGYGDDDFESC